MSLVESGDVLERHILNLKYAVATTQCEKTRVVLAQMLQQAEARLATGHHPNACHSFMR